MRTVPLSSLVLLSAAGCVFSDPLDRTFGPGGRTIREVIAEFPGEQREAFGMASRRCARCHDLNTVFAAHVPSGSWRAQVRKMVRKPGAAIPEEDAEKIAAFFEYLSEWRSRHPDR